LVSDVGLNAVEIALVAKLAADGGVTALVPATNHYNSMVPPDGSFPAIIFQLVGHDRRAEAMDSDAESLLYNIKCITKGEASPNTVGATADAIDTLFEKGTLAPTGWSIYAIRRERRIRYVEYDDEKNPIWHDGAQYRLWTVKP